MKQIFILTIAALLISCGTSAPKSAQTTDGERKLEFKMVEPPITITDPAAAQQWVADNYWNRFDMADTAFIGSEELKNAFAIYSMLLVNVPDRAHSVAAITSMLQKAQTSPLMHAELVRLGEGYLGDPNSEMRNDTLFLALLDYMIDSPIYDSLSKIRPRTLKEATLKNKVGDRVGDFSWTDSKGGKGSLFAVKSPLTLLMFYTPGCETCKALFAEINSDPTIAQAIEKGRLKLIAVYADQEKKEWDAYIPNITSQWINVIANSDFATKKPFIIRATPSLYLLDAQKRVVVRDGVSHYQIIEKL